MVSEVRALAQDVRARRVGRQGAALLVRAPAPGGAVTLYVVACLLSIPAAAVGVLVAALRGERDS